MTDSQLDEIERVASKFGHHPFVLQAELFVPGGLYYEMRRENERLRKEVEYHRECRKLDVPGGYD